MKSTRSVAHNTRWSAQRAMCIMLFAILAGAMSSGAQADDRGHKDRGGDRDRQSHERHEQRFLDARHHHNRYYPTPGYVVRTLPPQRIVAVHRGAHFYFFDGAWFRADGRYFIAVAAPIGIAIHVLPRFYTRLWIGGVPYYYANSVYYVQSPQGYVVTQPPTGQAIVEAPADSSGGATDEIIEQPADAQVSQAPADLYVYPARGQNQQRLDTDRNECHAWAVAKAGYDPNHASTGFQIGQKRLDYDRAISACLEGRGYTVK